MSETSKTSSSAAWIRRWLVLVGLMLWASWGALGLFYNVNLQGVWLMALVLLCAMSGQTMTAPMLTVFYEMRTQTQATTVGIIAGLAVLGWLMLGTAPDINGALSAYAVRGFITTIIMPTFFYCYTNHIIQFMFRTI